MKKTVAVIGGGASGITAALCCAESGKADVILIEKNDRIGKKLLVTGNGKCNITNAAITPLSYESELARATLGEYGTEKTKEFFSSLGLVLRADSSGRYYPYSESAKSVMNIFLGALEKSGVKIITSFDAEKIEKKEKFIIHGNYDIYADCVIMAVGSEAGVKNYDGLRLLSRSGIRYNTPSPSLCPVPSSEEFLKSLKGVRAKGTVTLGNETQSGEIQFNEKNISGICVFNLSGKVKDGDIIHIDFAPEYSVSELSRIIKLRKESCAKAENILDGIAQKRLALVLLKRAGVALTESAAAADEKSILCIASLLKDFSVRVNAPRDFRYAQAAHGGVGADEINPDTLESKKAESLFFCGEIADVDGPCGGYNLQWAFSSGMKAAKGALKNL